MQNTKQQGFTLIELMVTLIVLAIAIGIAIPNFSTWIKNNRIDSATRSLTSAFQLARSEAVSRQTVITVNSGGDWGDGLSIYTDSNPTGNTAYNALEDTLIKDLDYSMDGITTTKTDDVLYISFTSTGLLNEDGNPRVITICDDRGVAEGTAISINIVGRTTIGAAGACP